ncbi:MAG: putative glycoside hydrolase [Clostridiaceae bacterium]|nr:putative glycoside hydrolase [Clostridiaceae bacterium]
MILIIAIPLAIYLYYNGRNQRDNRDNLENNSDKIALEDSNTKDSGDANREDPGNNAQNSGINGDSGNPGNTGPAGSNGNRQDNSSGNTNADNTGNTGTGNNENNSAGQAPGTVYVSPVKKPDAVKALYLTGWTAGTASRLDFFVNLANKTEINSYVLDIKDDDGYVGYESGIPAVREINAWKHKYNADKVIKTLHDNNIYLIGRLVCFKDPVLSLKRADLAVKNKNGGLWRDNNVMTWLDPYNRDSWPYIIEIAKEAVQKGFDEIQFDYIRFPNDGDKSAMIFNSGGEEKYEAINEFLAYARRELPDVPISADVFGIICESPEDTEDIGQYLELIGKDIEYICPMVYPSHYAKGQVVNNVKFPKPDLEPYAVVYNSLVKAKNRLTQLENYKAGIRPYLQGFTATWLKQGNYQAYGPKQIREQIQAVYDAGLTEWIIWDPSCKYPEEAFELEEVLEAEESLEVEEGSIL